MAKTILVVDDSRSIRQMVSFTLNDAGFEVIEAEDGKDALSKINGKPIHMVITDLHMPELNGIELIRELRTKPSYRYIPIIMLTTESQTKKKQEGKEAGATGWIVKPFNPEQLIGVINKVMA